MNRAFTDNTVVLRNLEIEGLEGLYEKVRLTKYSENFAFPLLNIIQKTVFFQLLEVSITEAFGLTSRSQ